MARGLKYLPVSMHSSRRSVHLLDEMRCTWHFLLRTCALSRRLEDNDLMDVADGRCNQSHCIEINTNFTVRTTGGLLYSSPL